MVLYADILFLVNLSMDFLTLYLCARISRQPAGKGRLLAGASLGAAGSVLLVICGVGRLLTLVAGILLSVGMTAAAFGFGPTVRWFGRQCILVWGSAAITGGCMSVLMSMGKPVYLVPAETQTSFAPVFLGTAVVVYTLIRLLQKRLEAKSARIRIGLHGKTAEVTVLVDSGNLLTDPLTGRDVILVSAEAVRCLQLPAGDLSHAVESREHMLPIPAKGVNGSRLLWGIRPDFLVINGQRKDALIAAEAVPADHYGGFSGTCPPSLL